MAQYTRESLLAEWEALSPSDELSTEVQDLFLSFLNRPSRANRPKQGSTRIVQSVSSVHEAPQRFQRPRHGGDKAPYGPGKAREPLEMICQHDPGTGQQACIQLAAPAGPTAPDGKASSALSMQNAELGLASVKS